MPRILHNVVKSGIGAAIGWWGVALLSNSVGLRLVGVLVCVALANLIALIFYVRAFRIRSRGGNLPSDAPIVVKRLDHKLVAARVALETAPAESDWSTDVVAMAQSSVRKLAVEAAEAGHGDRALQVVASRKPTEQSSAHMKDAWLRIEQAVKAGILEGESLRKAP
jgi:hypothetical protein